MGTLCGLVVLALMFALGLLAIYASVESGEYECEEEAFSEFYYMFASELEDEWE